MLVNTVKIKTDTETLLQIKELVEFSNNASEEINQAIIEAIEKLHKKTFNDQPTLILVDSKQFDIKPKKEYKKFLLDLTGVKGPYKVTKTYKSWVGLSEGVYEIEGCDKLIPVSWCNTKSSNNSTPFSTYFWLICSLLQSAAILLLL